MSVIGIWGMGDIGKTAIAEEMFKKLYSEYDSYYFLENEEEESRRHGTISLKQNFFLQHNTWRKCENEHSAWVVKLC